MNAKIRVAGLFGAVASALLIVSIAAPRAQQPQATQKPQEKTEKPASPEKSQDKPQEKQEKPAEPAKPQEGPLKPTEALVPVAASSVAARPDAYVDEFVTLTGTVEASVSKTAFSVDQDANKSTGKEVLVIAPRMNGAVDPNTYVTVIGKVVKFDPATIASLSKAYDTNLPPEAAVKFKDKPTILATSVINAASVDLAKWLPPPMSPAEEAFDKTMKSVGPAFGAIRKGVEASDAEAVTKNAATLVKAFAHTESFMKDRDLDDAEDWAENARKIAEDIQKAASGGNWDTVKASSGTLQKACGQCHGAYRVRGEDGTYYIKPKAGE